MSSQLFLKPGTVNPDIKTCAVVGFGKTGRAVLDFILERGLFRNIFLFNDNPVSETELKNRYQQRGVEFIQGENNFRKLGYMDLIIISPGVNGQDPRFERIRQNGIRIVSEIEFATGFIQAKIIAVTGTNGKSTTVSLIDHILSRNGFDTFLAGNIGTPLIAKIDHIQNSSVVVLEVSSFQLEEIEQFRPYIAVLLNVTPDHLDRYPSLEAYLSAKLNIFKNQQESDYLVVNEDDPLLVKMVSSRSKKISFSIQQKLDQGYFISPPFVVENSRNGEGKISLEKNPLKGIHNLENLLASIVVARLMGVKREAIENCIEDFKGLPHRMESVGRIGKVEFINDSKATNVDATLKSIKSVESNLILILGGKDKGGDFNILKSFLGEGIEKVFLIGESARIIFDQLNPINDKFEFVKDFKEVVEKGYDILKKKGGVVLLAPGCASFDMFNDFEHRGQVFRQEVNTLKERLENG
jgi:UDP-N-acetylmuramoylalanine--D-glutamate ligase